MIPKAIETRYNGYRFRSRLEARWAIYFDTLAIDYQYEKEGFDLGAAGYYLPDFWLPHVKMWAEVKADVFGDEETKKCIALVQATGFPVLMLTGPPDYREYEAIERDVDAESEFATTAYPYTLCTQYLADEHRFFAASYYEKADDFISTWPEMHYGIQNARAARFEHGESGVTR